MDLRWLNGAWLQFKVVSTSLPDVGRSSDTLHPVLELARSEFHLSITCSSNAWQLLLIIIIIIALVLI